MRGLMHRFLTRSLIAGVTIVAACSGDDDDTSDETTVAPATTSASNDTTAGGAAAIDLAAACPDPLVIQTNWFPEGEHGGLYEMVGEGYTVDTDQQVVRGPLIAGGQETGIDIELRAGGPAIGNQPVSVLQYTDDSIHLGHANTEGQLLRYDETPVLAGRRADGDQPSDDLLGSGDEPGRRDVGRSGRAGDHDQRLRGRDVHRGLRRRRHLGRRPDRPVIRRQPGPVRRRGRRDRPAGLRLERALHVREPRGVGQAGRATRRCTMPASRCTRRRWPSCPTGWRSCGRASSCSCRSSSRPPSTTSRRPTGPTRIIIDAVEQYDTFWTYDEGLAQYSVETQTRPRHHRQRAGQTRWATWTRSECSGHRPDPRRRARGARRPDRRRSGHQRVRRHEHRVITEARTPAPDCA